MEFNVLNEKIEINRKHLIAYFGAVLLSIIMTMLVAFLLYLLLAGLPGFIADNGFFLFYPNMISAFGGFLGLLTIFFIFYIANKQKYEFNQKDLLSLASVEFIFIAVMDLIGLIFTISRFLSIGIGLDILIHPLLTFLPNAFFGAAYLYIILDLYFNKSLKNLTLSLEILVVCLLVVLLPDIFIFLEGFSDVSSTGSYFLGEPVSGSGSLGAILFFASTFDIAHISALVIQIISLIDKIIFPLFIINYFIYKKGKISKYFYYIAFVTLIAGSISDVILYVGSLKFASVGFDYIFLLSLSLPWVKFLIIYLAALYFSKTENK